MILLFIVLLLTLLHLQHVDAATCASCDDCACDRGQKYCPIIPGCSNPVCEANCLHADEAGVCRCDDPVRSTNVPETMTCGNEPNCGLASSTGTNRCFCDTANPCHDDLVCNIDFRRCYFCPAGEFGCHCRASRPCDPGLNCTETGRCAKGEFTVTGNLGDPCHVSLAPATKCFDPNTYCNDEYKCVQCSAPAEEGCSCSRSSDCAQGHACDALTSRCVRCSASTATEPPRSVPTFPLYEVMGAGIGGVVLCAALILCLVACCKRQGKRKHIVHRPIPMSVQAGSPPPFAANRPARRSSLGGSRSHRGSVKLSRHSRALQPQHHQHHAQPPPPQSVVRTTTTTTTTTKSRSAVLTFEDSRDQPPPPAQQAPPAQLPPTTYGNLSLRPAQNQYDRVVVPKQQVQPYDSVNIPFRNDSTAAAQYDSTNSQLAPGGHYNSPFVLPDASMRDNYDRLAPTSRMHNNYESAAAPLSSTPQYDSASSQLAPGGHYNSPFVLPDASVRQQRDIYDRPAPNYP